MRVIETVIAWTLLIAGGIIGASTVVIGMLELLPDIVRGSYEDIVHH